MIVGTHIASQWLKTAYHHFPLTNIARPKHGQIQKTQKNEYKVLDQMPKKIMKEGKNGSGTTPKLIRTRAVRPYKGQQPPARRPHKPRRARPTPPRPPFHKLQRPHHSPIPRVPPDFDRTFDRDAIRPALSCTPCTWLAPPVLISPNTTKRPPPQCRRQHLSLNRGSHGIKRRPKWAHRTQF